MRLSTRDLLAIALTIAWAASPPHAVGADDVAHIQSQEFQIGGDPQQRYLLIGPQADEQPPAEGWKLVVVLPGGDGSANFHPFVKRIRHHALPAGYLVAQPIAVRWTPQQVIVWPTGRSRVAQAKFTTEQFVDAVIKDVGQRHPLDPRYCFTLSWSSGGPAAYAISLASEKVTGSFVAMSVFKSSELAPLSKAQGHAYFLYHSPDDRLCPFRMAQQADRQLAEAGAQVKLVTYDGGHGWRGGLYDDLRLGFQWLETTVDKP